MLWYLGSSPVISSHRKYIEQEATFQQLACHFSSLSSFLLWGCLKGKTNRQLKTKIVSDHSLMISKRNLNLLPAIMIFFSSSFPVHHQVCSRQRILRCRSRAEAGRSSSVWGGSLRSGQVLGGGQAARRLQEALHQQPLKRRLPWQETQEGVSATRHRVHVGQLLAC